jgi:hypothetical protein
VTKGAAQRSHSALLMAVSMSNGSWTFYEAIKVLPFKGPLSFATVNSTHRG